MKKFIKPLSLLIAPSPIHVLITLFIIYIPKLYEWRSTYSEDWFLLLRLNFIWPTAMRMCHSLENLCPCSWDRASKKVLEHTIVTCLIALSYLYLFPKYFDLKQWTVRHAIMKLTMNPRWREALCFKSKYISRMKQDMNYEKAVKSF